MKYVKPLAWEAGWLVYGFVAMIAVPVAGLIEFSDEESVVREANKTEYGLVAYA